MSGKENGPLAVFSRFLRPGDPDSEDIFQFKGCINSGSFGTVYKVTNIPPSVEKNRLSLDQQ